MCKSFQVILGRCAKMRKCVTNRQTDRPTDRPTDQGQLMSCWSRLKKEIEDYWLRKYTLRNGQWRILHKAESANLIYVLLYYWASQDIISFPHSYTSPAIIIETTMWPHARLVSYSNRINWDTGHGQSSLHGRLTSCASSKAERSTDW